MPLGPQRLDALGCGHARQLASKLGSLNHPLPLRGADVRLDNLLLEGGDQAVELKRPRADAAIVDLAQVAGQQLIRHLGARCDLVQVRVDIISIAADLWRRAERHVFAVWQFYHHAGPHRFDPVARIILLGVVAQADRVFVVGAPERDEARRDLSPHHLGVVVVVEVAQVQHDRRQPRHAAQLAGARDVEDVADLSRGDHRGLVGRREPHRCLAGV